MTSPSERASFALDMQTQSDHVFVKPAQPGLVMYDPTTRMRLSDEGMLVPRDTYWRRRLANGDAVLAREPKSERAPRAEAKEA